MMTLRMLSALLATASLLVWSQPGRSEDMPVDEAAEKTSTAFTIYVDSDIKDPRYGSYVQVRMDDVTLEDLANLHVTTKDGVSVVNYDNKQPIKVTIHLPIDMDHQDEEAFVQAIEQKLNQSYDHPTYIIKRSYIPATVQRDSEELARDEASVAKAQFSLNQWFERTKLVARQIRLKAYRPEQVDLTMGTAFGLIRSVGAVSAFMKDTGLNIYGVSQSLVSIGTSQFFTRYPTQINKWKAEHEIPVLKKNPLVAMYNDSPYIKTLAINQLITASIQTVYRVFSHMNDPATYSSPWSTDWLKILGKTVPLTVIRSMGDSGATTLLKKGKISRRLNHYLVNLFSLQNMVTNQLNAFEKKEKKRTGISLLWLSIFAEVGIKGGVWAMSKFLPAEHHRITILHPDLQEIDRDQVAYVNELRSGYLTEDVITEAALQELEQTGIVLDRKSPFTTSPRERALSRLQEAE